MKRAVYVPLDFSTHNFLYLIQTLYMACCSIWQKWRTNARKLILFRFNLALSYTPRASRPSIYFIANSSTELRWLHLRSLDIQVYQYLANERNWAYERAPSFIERITKMVIRKHIHKIRQMTDRKRNPIQFQIILHWGIHDISHASISKCFFGRKKMYVLMRLLLYV